MIGFISILLISFFFSGLVNRTKSIVAGRKGPVILQPAKDVIKLLRKGSVYSSTSSIIFRVAPTIYFSSVLSAILFIPFGTFPGILSFNFDFVMFAYLLAFGKFFMIIASLDTGSSFEGMGASREALYSMLIEPAFFITMGSLSLFTGYTSFYRIFESIHFINPEMQAVSISFSLIAVYVFMVMGLIENSRMPVDDPNTHLELTMIHEVMVLDNSGFDLGLILFTSFLKFAMYGALISNLFLSYFSSIPVMIIIFLGIQFLYAVFTGLVESFMARFRINQNPQFVLLLSSVALLIFLIVMIKIGRIG